MELFPNNRVFQFVLKNWSKLEETEKVLKLFYVITIRLQKIEYTLSDFYGDVILSELKLKKWIECAMSTNLSSKLLESINNRKADLIENKAMICAVFLDPRFKCNLTSDEVALTKWLLCDMWAEIKGLKQRESSSNSIPDHWSVINNV